VVRKAIKEKNKRVDKFFNAKIRAQLVDQVMNVIALVSGGKDSTCAMMKAVSYGHKLVAMANIYRGKPGTFITRPLLLYLTFTTGEADSWMYDAKTKQCIYLFCSKVSNSSW
jgi:hypothetical protein